ncbi:MAG: TraB/GumN family protein [Sphingomicrobium sp.]
MQTRLGFSGAHRVRTKACRTGAVSLLAAAMVALSPTPLAALPSLAVVPTAPNVEQPALWMLRDTDTTIYLFGTFHALDARTDWFGRNVRAAFDSSDQLILETLAPTDPLELADSLARHALAAPLIPGAPVVRGAFATSARQAMSAGRSAGMTVDRGADAVLRRIADAEGKPVGGLESFDTQLAMLAGLPAAKLTPITVGPHPGVQQLMLDMQSAWRRGDGSAFAAVLGSLEAQSPAAYRKLFVDRNDDWAGWVARRMDRPGTVFVAVGTGHLIGRDSVQQKLALRGYTITRIN